MKFIRNNDEPFIIAEVGQNHQGDLDIAKKYISQFSKVGADAIKFQTRNIDTLFSKEALNREYDNPNSFGQTYGEHRRKLELSLDELKTLKKECDLNNVLFISGDVHYSEISKVETDFYPLFDFTSSGLSSTWRFATPNKNRIEGPVMDNHFGLITIDFTETKNEFVKFENWDIHDNQRFEYTIDLKNIDFKEIE